MTVSLAAESSIEERLREVCGHLNVLHAQLVDLAAEALETGSWQGRGVRSLAHWLTWQAGITPAHAVEVVRLAEARQSHPHVMARFAEGELSIDQAAVATKSPAYLDGHFAQVATAATIPQLRLMVRAARPISLTAVHTQPTAEPSIATVPGEWLRCEFDDDGRYHVRGEFDPDHGRVIDAALSECRDALFHAGQRDVSWSDALVELAERSIDHQTAPRRDKFRVNWFVDPTDPVPARWTDGIAIPDWLREHLLCDGTVSPTFTASGRPVSVGRSVRDLPDRTRRLVLRRDGKCRVPSCTQTRWLQVHHVVHQAAGGGHDTANLVALCPHDHRLHHRGQLGIAGNADDPDGLVFTDADGRVIDPAAHPTKPTGPPPSPARPYQHPLGERLQHWALLYPDPPRPAA